MTIHLKEGDTRPPITAFLRDENGNAVNLSGGSVAFSMGEGASRVSGAACTVLDPAAGAVQYSWDVADTFVPGRFDGEFQVTYSNGKKETFPRRGYFGLQIDPREAAPGALLDLAIASMDARHALVLAAFGQSTSDRFLDLNGDGFVLGADISLATAAQTNMDNLKAGVDAEVVAFRSVPDEIRAMIAGTETPVPVKTVAGQALLIDIDGSGAIDNTDLLYAEAIARHGT